ncbi:MAG: MaoC family dehydratase [Chloroflexota bacterium]
MAEAAEQTAQPWNGRFFEDFSVGQVLRHRLGRTILEADNAWFTLLTLNTNQVHFNAQYAQRSPYGRILVNSGFTIALVLGLSVSDISENAMANLGMDAIRLPYPVFVGDTLYAESLVTAVRESRSRPYAGIVSVHTRGLNQDGAVCITFDRSAMIYKRDAPQVQNLFPQAAEPLQPPP